MPCYAEVARGCPGNGSDKKGTDAPDVQEHPEVRRMGGEGNIIPKANTAFSESPAFAMDQS